jgi:hypothetical protein
MWGRVSTRVRASRERAGGLSFLGACLFAAAAGSDASRTEIFTGFEASDNYTSGYVGGSYALSKTGRPCSVSDRFSSLSPPF